MSVPPRRSITGKLDAYHTLADATSFPPCREADSGVRAEAHAAPVNLSMLSEKEWPGEEMEGTRIDGVQDRAMGRILIVDDEISIVKNMAAILSEFGYEVTGVVSADEALESLKQQDFDILLTDLELGGMDGIELLQAALNVKPDLIGIIITGYATVETAVEAMKCGAFDCITKPFKPGQLLPGRIRGLSYAHQTGLARVTFIGQVRGASRRAQMLQSEWRAGQ